MPWITTGTLHGYALSRQNTKTGPKIPTPEFFQRPENFQCNSQCSRPRHAAPNSALRPLYVPYDMSSAPLAGVIHLSPLADINRDNTPDAVPAAINGVVYPIEYVRRRTNPKAGSCEVAINPRMEASTGVQHGDATRADDAPGRRCGRRGRLEAKAGGGSDRCTPTR